MELNFIRSNLIFWILFDINLQNYFNEWIGSYLRSSTLGRKHPFAQLTA